jgi:hypothetical protein
MSHAKHGVHIDTPIPSAKEMAKRLNLTKAEWQMIKDVVSGADSKKRTVTERSKNGVKSGARKNGVKTGGNKNARTRHVEAANRVKAAR